MFPLPQNPPQQAKPQTVLGVQKVSLALVSYADESGTIITQLAVVGDSNVNMLESRTLGFSKSTTPQGKASKWLTDGILSLLAKGK